MTQARNSRLYELLESDMGVFIDSDLLERLRTSHTRARVEVFGEDDYNKVILFYEYLRGVFGKSVGETALRRVFFNFLYYGT